MSYTKEEIKESKDFLLSVLRPGDAIYGLVRQVALSGMSRHISFFIPLSGGIKDISWHVAKILDYKQAGTGALKVSGCGMDMVFHCIYNLGRSLFNTPSSWNYHTGRNGDKGPETDGGYFLKEEIL